MLKAINIGEHWLYCSKIEANRGSAEEYRGAIDSFPNFKLVTISVCVSRVSSRRVV